MILDKDERIKSKILNAIMEDPEIVLLLKEKYVDEEIWKFCIDRDPTLFKKMKRPSNALCLYACSVDGSNLKYIKNKFKNIKITGMMCYISVKSNPKAILHVPKCFLSDDLKEMAFDRDPSLMAFFDDVREDYIKKLINEKPSAIRFILHPNEDLVCDMIKDDPNICSFLNTMTERMVEVLKETHMDYYELYKSNIVVKNS